MKLRVLFIDELRGFYKSKVMIFLWIGLPVIALLFRFISARQYRAELVFHSYFCTCSIQYWRHAGFSDACSVHNQREKQTCL